MNKLLFAMFSIAVVGLALTACASQDRASRVVLPLDHGPRAQTTPWSNQQRLRRAEEARAQQADKDNRMDMMMKECGEMMKREK